MMQYYHYKISRKKKTAANSLARSFLKINLFSYTYSLQFKYKMVCVSVYNIF